MLCKCGHTNVAEGNTKNAPKRTIYIGQTMKGSYLLPPMKIGNLFYSGSKLVYTRKHGFVHSRI